eukprot:TRINITY_DN25056_c0_g1_i2.p1 TRINITY_DN25056_c0_g1~~TRINITY_DN25056_c0_g1_i2.p1  ORF type:complete len:352 (+),score=97.63 TRINITY_DN25056_c0_g1_i2:56-1057(+)
MGVRGDVLRHKSYHVWNAENRRRVEEDEARFREEKRQRKAKRREYAAEARYDALVARKRGRAEVEEPRGGESSSEDTEEAGYRLDGPRLTPAEKRDRSKRRRVELEERRSAEAEERRERAAAAHDEATRRAGDKRWTAAPPLTGEAALLPSSMQHLLRAAASEAGPAARPVKRPPRSAVPEMDDADVLAAVGLAPDPASRIVREPVFEQRSRGAKGITVTKVREMDASHALGGRDHCSKDVIASNRPWWDSDLPARPKVATRWTCPRCGAKCVGGQTRCRMCRTARPEAGSASSAGAAPATSGAAASALRSEREERERAERERAAKLLSQSRR